MERAAAATRRARVRRATTGTRAPTGRRATARATTSATRRSRSPRAIGRAGAGKPLRKLLSSKTHLESHLAPSRGSLAARCRRRQRCEASARAPALHTRTPTHTHTHNSSLSHHRSASATAAASSTRSAEYSHHALLRRRPYRSIHPYRECALARTPSTRRSRSLRRRSAQHRPRRPRGVHRALLPRDRRRWPLVEHQGGRRCQRPRRLGVGDLARLRLPLLFCARLAPPPEPAAHLPIDVRPGVGARRDRLRRRRGRRHRLGRARLILLRVGRGVQSGRAALLLLRVGGVGPRAHPRRRPHDPQPDARAEQCDVARLPRRRVGRLAGVHAAGARAGAVGGAQVVRAARRPRRPPRNRAQLLGVVRQPHPPRAAAGAHAAADGEHAARRVLAALPIRRHPGRHLHRVLVDPRLQPALRGLPRVHRAPDGGIVAQRAARAPGRDLALLLVDLGQLVVLGGLVHLVRALGAARRPGSVFVAAPRLLRRARRPDAGLAALAYFS